MEQPNNHLSSRRRFIRQSAIAAGGAMLIQDFANDLFANNNKATIKVNGHLWVYASKYPPKWDCTPNLETVFADMSAAGIDGVELMESVLRYDDSVTRINGYIKKYNFPVSGTSYGVGIKMWDAGKHKEILDDVELIVSRLHQVKGKTFGISVGDKPEPKTEAELDAQADILQKILLVCQNNEVVPNLHNHTYEVTNGMHDLKGTLARIPDINLGPDLNWLIRAGINPVDFINTYGKQIVYLHIRDQYANGKWTEYLGQGATDFPAIAKALKAQNFKGSAAIELAFEKDFIPSNPLKEDWKRSRKYVKDVFKW